MENSIRCEITNPLFGREVQSQARKIVLCQFCERKGQLLLCVQDKVSTKIIKYYEKTRSSSFPKS